MERHQDSVKSGTGSNFDELISKRLKQRKKCTAAVLDQLAGAAPAGLTLKGAVHANDLGPEQGLGA